MANYFLSAHAKQRLTERSSLLEIDLPVIISKSLPITMESYTHRLSFLYFSVKDERFLIFVMDLLNNEIITILPLEYWENLRSTDSGKHRIQNLRDVSHGDFLAAVKLTDPDHEILRFPPLRSGQKLYLFLLGSDQNRRYRLRTEPTSLSIFVDDSEWALAFVVSAIKDFVDSHQALPTYMQLSERSRMKSEDGWFSHEIDEHTEISAITQSLVKEVAKRRKISEKYRFFPTGL